MFKTSAIDPGKLLGPAGLARGNRGAGGLLRLVLAWRQRAESRRALRDLDDRLLRDIGLDRVDAKLEADKPFWQL